MNDNESFSDNVKRQLETIKDGTLDIVLQLVLREKTRRIFRAVGAPVTQPIKPIEGFDAEFLKAVGIKQPAIDTTLNRIITIGGDDV